MKNSKRVGNEFNEDYEGEEMNAKEQLLEDFGFDDGVKDVDQVLNILQESGTEEAVNFIAPNVEGSEMAHVSFNK